MTFDVPKYSQRLDVFSKDWRDRACGIVAVKTAMDFYGIKTPSVDELIKEGLEIDAYIHGVGWKHQGLLDLAVRYGCEGERFDWKERTPTDALKNLKKLLAIGPVICSIHKDFDPANGGHLIVVTGMEDRAVSYAEPDSATRDDVHRVIPVQMLFDGWKQRGIMILKK